MKFLLSLLFRPQLLVLIDPPINGIVLNEKSKKLISLASQLKAGKLLNKIFVVYFAHLWVML